MTTLTEKLAETRHPLAVRWELATDRNGRTRPEMRWQSGLDGPRAATQHPPVPIAA